MSMDRKEREKAIEREASERVERSFTVPDCFDPTSAEDADDIAWFKRVDLLTATSQVRREYEAREEAAGESPGQLLQKLLDDHRRDQEEQRRKDAESGQFPKYREWAAGIRKAAIDPVMALYDAVDYLITQRANISTFIYAFSDLDRCPLQREVVRMRQLVSEKFMPAYERVQQLMSTVLNCLVKSEHALREKAGLMPDVMTFARENDNVAEFRAALASSKDLLTYNHKMDAIMIETQKREGGKLAKMLAAQVTEANSRGAILETVPLVQRYLQSEEFRKVDSRVRGWMAKTPAELRVITRSHANPEELRKEVKAKSETKDATALHARWTAECKTPNRSDYSPDELLVLAYLSHPFANESATDRDKRHERESDEAEYKSEEREFVGWLLKHDFLIDAEVEAMLTGFAQQHYRELMVKWKIEGADAAVYKRLAKGGATTVTPDELKSAARQYYETEGCRFEQTIEVVTNWLHNLKLVRVIFQCGNVLLNQQLGNVEKEVRANLPILKDAVLPIQRLVKRAAESATPASAIEVIVAIRALEDAKALAVTEKYKKKKTLAAWTADDAGRILGKAAERPATKDLETFWAEFEASSVAGRKDFEFTYENLFIMAYILYRRSDRFHPTNTKLLEQGFLVTEKASAVETALAHLRKRQEDMQEMKTNRDILVNTTESTERALPANIRDVSAHIQTLGRALIPLPVIQQYLKKMQHAKIGSDEANTVMATLSKSIEPFAKVLESAEVKQALKYVEDTKLFHFRIEFEIERSGRVQKEWEEKRRLHIQMTAQLHEDAAQALKETQSKMVPCPAALFGLCTRPDCRVPEVALIKRTNKCAVCGKEFHHYVFNLRTRAWKDHVTMNEKMNEAMKTQSAKHCQRAQSTAAAASHAKQSE